MIKSIQFKNVKCLKDVKLDINPITVLVGSNGSGKSAILRALKGDLGDYVYGTAESLAEIHTDLDGDDGVIVVDGHYRARHSSPIKDVFDTQLIDLTGAVRHESKPWYGATSLQRDGGNLAAFFQRLRPESKRKVTAKLYREGIDNIKFCAYPKNYLHLEFKLFGSDEWVGTRRVSEGLLRFFAFCLLRYQERKPCAIMIEEPERGLHPFLLGRLMAEFVYLSEQNINIIIATHSAELLEHANPEDVRFLSLDQDGATIIGTASTDDPLWQVAFEAHNNSLSGAWLSGGLGGFARGRDRDEV